MSCLTGPAGVDPSGTKGKPQHDKRELSKHRRGRRCRSHKDTIHVAVITCTGRPVDDQEFPTTEAGYRQAVAWLGGHGPVQAVGVEGTSSDGTGSCAALTKAGVTVVEVNRTRAAERRKQGKTDPLDAYRAARSVLSGEAATDPKRASIEAAAGAERRPPIRGQVPTGRVASDRRAAGQRPRAAA